MAPAHSRRSEAAQTRSSGSGVQRSVRRCESSPHRYSDLRHRLAVQELAAGLLAGSARGFANSAVRVHLGMDAAF